MGSQYLMKPPRTLREACKEVAAIDPQFAAGDCEHCINYELCTIYQRIESGLPEMTAAGCRKQLILRLRTALKKPGPKT
jgi:hypothetical protein